MIGTRAISGSPATSFRKRSIAAALSSIASSMLTSMIWAPFSTCWRATASASSKRPSRIMRAKALLPVTLVRSPMLTNRCPSPMVTGSRPARRMGGGVAVADSAGFMRRSPRFGEKWVSAVAVPGGGARRSPRAWRHWRPLQRSSGEPAF